MAMRVEGQELLCEESLGDEPATPHTSAVRAICCRLSAWFSVNTSCVCASTAATSWWARQGGRQAGQCDELCFADALQGTICHRLCTFA